MRFLCVSDIHGNLSALQAVLAACEKVNFQKILCAGEHLYPGAEAMETWRRLQAAQAVLVQGLGDKALAVLDPDSLAVQSDAEKEKLARFRGLRAELGGVLLERLRRLPAEHRITLEDGTELLLIHGSPMDPSEPFCIDMDDEEINALLGDEAADVIVCGGSHVPFDRTVAGVRIINVGSVGDAPDERAPGDPPKFAHATWIDSTPQGLHVEQFVVPLVATDE